MAQGVAWIGGTGNFNDPANWSSDVTGNPSDSPATPPGAKMRAEYLASGTVSFAGQSNGEADINNAGMVFDLSGGGYTLTGIGGNQALQFDVGEVESQSPTLTVTGANTLKTTGLNAVNAATITVTGDAILEVAGAATTFLFKSAVVSDAGIFAFDSGLNFTQYTGYTASLSVDGGTVIVGTSGATFAGGTVVTVQDKGTIDVAGSASFGTGVATFSSGSKLTASSLTIDADSQTSKHASLTLTGGGSNAKIAGSATVGDVGTAILSIDAGAAFQAQSLYVGVNSTSGGTVDLTGAGSSLVVSQTLDVGYLGAGALFASGGATVTVDGSMTIGASAGSSGAVTIAGAGDSLIVKGDLIVGADGSATLSVSKDATFKVTGEILIGDSTNSSAPASADVQSPTVKKIKGELNLTSSRGRSTLAEDCIIGDNEYGKLTLDNGFVVDANHKTIVLGRQNNGNGVVDVTGEDSAITNIKTLDVGEQGNASLKISFGGTVMADQLYVGGVVATQATVNVSIADLSVERMTLGRPASEGGGSATLTAGSGGKVQVTGSVTLGQPTFVKYANAILDLVGGSLAVGASAPARAGYLTVGKGGFARLFGAKQDVTANFEVSGGLLEVMNTGAVGASNIAFGSGGGTIEVAKGAKLINPVAQFGSNDKVRLDGVVANGDSFNPSNGVLSLLNGTQTVATLKFAGSYNPLGFMTNEVGGAAVVTYSAASVQERIFNSALFSDSLGHHALDAIGERGSATPDLWSVGHAPGGW